MSPQWRLLNLVCALDGDDVVLERKPVPKMRDELLQLFDRTELSKYMTDDELADYDAVAGEAK
jgi:succinate dehydrogenase / fumarate reductase flavoprotein subunit